MKTSKRSLVIAEHQNEAMLVAMELQQTQVRFYPFIFLPVRAFLSCLSFLYGSLSRNLIYYKHSKQIHLFVNFILSFFFLYKNIVHAFSTLQNVDLCSAVTTNLILGGKGAKGLVFKDAHHGCGRRAKNSHFLELLKQPL